MKLFSIEELEKMNDDEVYVIAEGCLSILVLSKLVGAKSAKNKQQIAAIEELKTNINQIKQQREK